MDPRVSMITLGVADFLASRKFYEEGLGFPRMKSEKPEEDNKVAFFTLNGTWLGLYPREALAEDAGIPSQGTGFSGITLAHNLESRDLVDSTFKKALDAGAKSVKKPREVFWGGYSGYFADFDGYLWEVAHNPYFWIGPPAGEEAQK